jgi:hypothetical protein
VYFAETAAYTIRTPTRTIPTATSTASPGHKHNAAILGGAVGGSLGALLLAVAILFCWIHRRRRSHRQLHSDVKCHPGGLRRSEMQGQLSHPTELPARNSAMMNSYKIATPSTSYEHKGISPARSSPPASTRSPVQSMPNHSPSSLSTNILPTPLFDARLESPVYQHPAHQPLGLPEYFPPPPVRSDILSESTLARPHTAHGRRHELPASRSPALVPGNVGEMSGESMESASRSTYSLT